MVMRQFGKIFLVLQISFDVRFIIFGVIIYVSLEFQLFDGDCLDIGLFLLLIQVPLNNLSSLQLVHLLKQLFVSEIDGTFSEEFIGANEETVKLGLKGFFLAHGI